MGKIIHSDGIEKKGNYILFEGIENSGKTTQSGLLRKYFESLGIPFIQLREPGSTYVGNGVRAILLDNTKEGIQSSEAELFLFEAARAELFQREIIPSLKRGEQIIADRNYFSSEAYQGYGRGMNLEMIRQLNSIATYGMKPDLAFIFDRPAEEALKAIEKKDRMESLGNDFHKRVRQGYLEIAAQNPDFCILIERENKTREEIHEEVKYHVKTNLGL